MSKTTKSIIIAASVIIVLIVGTIVISNIDTSKDNNVDTTDDLYSIYSADTTDILSVKAESENGTITVKSIGDSEWSVNDMDASEIDSSKAGALVGTISTLSSKTRLKKIRLIYHNTDLTIRKSLLQLKRKTVRLIK